MCGIIGATKGGLEIRDFNAARETQHHRGPDYIGTFEDQNVLISHLLLAIRGDIRESIQPVMNEESPWVLAFNGQLYNTAAIQRDLGVTGVATTVDTLLLFRLIKKHGWDFARHIHGMFAIALYNKAEKVLRLYRDQSGQKNLYYAFVNGKFVFASELKAILKFPFIKRDLDLLAIEVATSIGYVPGNRTFISDVRKLHPSEVMTFDMNTSLLSSELFISSGESEYDRLSPGEAISQTIVDHLQSKREISINLSGGLDSSLIFYESVRAGRTIHAFSTTFEGGDESHNADAFLAEKLAKDFNQEFTPIQITKESYLRNFINAYKAIEEPNYNISVPIYYQTACIEGIHGQGLRVVLSGDGGDELFGGYPHYRLIQRVENYKRLLTSYGVNVIKSVRNNDDTDYSEISDIFLHFRGLPSTFSTKNTKSNVRKYLKETTDLLLPIYSKKTDDVYRAMLLDRFFWLASENFIRSDKLYMSQSMEMRCPLAYTPLRTYMDTHISSKQYISADSNKIFLREIYDQKLPQYISKRKEKTGWRAPVKAWYDDTYKEHFLDILSAVEHKNEIIDWKKIKQVVERDEKWPGKALHFYLSLAILMHEYELV